MDSLSLLLKPESLLKRSCYFLIGRASLTFMSPLIVLKMRIIDSSRVISSLSVQCNIWRSKDCLMITQQSRMI
nr:MAG TPA: hypothetical protein [Caudoviricetes sp.]